MAASLVLAILTLAWFDATTLLDLKPLNNIAAYTKREIWLEGLVNTVILGIVIVLVLTGNPASAAWVVGIWLAVQLLTWYPAYVTGKPEKHARDLAAHHDGTLTVLPPIGDHPIPPLHQLVLQLMSLALLVALLLT
jgi:hypothetical protein